MGRSTPRRTFDGAKDEFPVPLSPVFIFDGSHVDLKNARFCFNSETDQIIRVDQPHTVGISNVLNRPTSEPFCETCHTEYETSQTVQTRTFEWLVGIMHTFYLVGVIDNEQTAGQRQKHIINS